jgi:hypothetical protein
VSTGTGNKLGKALIKLEHATLMALRSQSALWFGCFAGHGLTRLCQAAVRSYVLQTAATKMSLCLHGLRLCFDSKSGLACAATMHVLNS